ncbi:AraC family transcriptional regulator (plasmid) [Cupriavidus pinatubonensis]|uniref:AraC family transcriptional regulator n=1 Tax=Cupriavidus pinatubonensis TaxID=248026 RepID=UPI001C732BC3|nr:AraC family transcriptional regulator [Cupriavidus pinatubonensis]QYY33951.1 AraC family transcriptional regulator [Cupriavidus pinatubonensis]
MDPLSDVLSLLKPRTRFLAGLDTAGAWSFAFPPETGIKIVAVLRGNCWGMIEGLEQPVRFEEGDCFLLNANRRIVATSDPSLVPDDSEDIMKTIEHNGIAVHNGGGEVLMVGGLFAFSTSHAATLFDALPPLFSAPRDTSEAEILRWAIGQLGREVHEQLPGGALLSTDLVHMMLVPILRLQLTKSTGNLSPGWFPALSDRQIGAALSALHDQPARPWTLEELARISGVSRTIFAQRFKRLVGTTAMCYLSRWRMLKAAERLRDSTDSIASIAFSLGYESESAFSGAFKRIMLCTPTQCRREPERLAANTPA